MPKYLITSPDGQQFNVEGSGTADEALAHFQSTYRDQNYSNEGRAYKETPYEKMGTLEQVGTAIKGALGRIAAPVVPDVQAPKVTIRGQETSLGGVNRGPMEAANKYYEENKDQLGTAAAIADPVTELAVTMNPLVKAGGVVGRGIESGLSKVLPKAAAKVAPVVGDVVANAAYSGASAAGRGDSAGDILQSTLLGGAGAAAGHAVTTGLSAGVKAAGGAATNALRRGVTPEARALLDEGIELTPGQMNPFLGRIEEAAKNVPGLGRAIERAQERSGGQYVKKEIDNALAPLEQGVTNTGRKGLDEAHDIISNSYNKFVDDVHIVPADLRANLVKLDDTLKPTYGLTGKQQDTLYDVVVRKLSPLMENAEKEGTTITGRAFKNADSDIGDLARQYVKSTKPKDQALGEALYEMQRQLRSSLSPQRLGAVEDLTKANLAFKNMLAVQKAGNREGGMFTPEQLRKQLVRSGEKPRPLNQAATEVLHKGNTSGGRNRLFGNFLLGTHSLPAAVATWAAGAGIGKLVYNPSSIRAIARHLDPAQKVALLKAPPSAQRIMLRKAMAKVPTLATQGGRMIAEPDQGD